MIARSPGWFRLVAATCLTATVAAGCREPSAHPAVGKKLGTLPVAPLADPAAAAPPLAGRVTLLNFWGTWCPPCRRELPGLARLAAGLASEPRFQLVAVSCAGGGGSRDPADLAAETAEFLISQNLTLPAYVFSDPVGADVLATTLGLDALPATYLVGPDATVRHAWIGYRPRDEAEIAAAIVTLLKEPASPPAGFGRAGGGAPHSGGRIADPVWSAMLRSWGPSGSPGHRSAAGGSGGRRERAALGHGRLRARAGT